MTLKREGVEGKGLTSWEEKGLHLSHDFDAAGTDLGHETVVRM